MALERACGACGSAFPLPVLVSTSTKSGTTKFRLRLRKHVLASAEKFKGDRDAPRSLRFARQIEGFSQ
jgi:hypothetical protein